MAETLSLRTTTDLAAVMRRVVGALRAGKVVALPTESTYHLAGSGLSPTAIGRLPGPVGEPLTVALRGAGEARDWAPRLSPLGQRLARRNWPGRLTLATAAGVELGLVNWLPEPVRARVNSAGTIYLHAPAHRAVVEVLRNWPGPLVLTPVAAATAEQVLQAPDRVDLVLDAGPCLQEAPPTVIAVNGASWRLLRPGAASEEHIKQRAACLIVFVCTGNTCRSPLAEVLFKKQLADRLGCAVAELPSHGFIVISAGLAAMMGGGAAAEAVATASSFGADLSAHRSRPLTVEIAAQADYLIAMTRDHLLGVVDHFPQLAAVPRLLDPAGSEVPDPIGQDQEVYAACGRQIWECVQPLLAEVAPT